MVTWASTDRGEDPVEVELGEAGVGQLAQLVAGSGAEDGDGSTAGHHGWSQLGRSPRQFLEQTRA